MQHLKGMELELKAKVLGPMGTLMATTKTNAEILCQEDNLGTVEPGKYADLLVVNGDPLEDITLFQDYQTNLKVIMKDGVIHKKTL
jgi:imidazolonepropionase-like amidohydrolase